MSPCYTPVKLMWLNFVFEDLTQALLRDLKVHRETQDATQSLRSPQRREMSGVGDDTIRDEIPRPVGTPYSPRHWHSPLAGVTSLAKRVE